MRGGCKDEDTNSYIVVLILMYITILLPTSNEAILLSAATKLKNNNMIKYILQRY